MILLQQGFLLKSVERTEITNVNGCDTNFRFLKYIYMLQLQEYCALIDSSSSFRAYRHALAETQPPCIPYIGLILQDLTFVHIGNPDLLADGHHINFGKRWQQFHILENMRRFQKCHYQFKRNERIVAFFNEFNDVLCEESMWQISESIRPRGSNQSSSKKQLATSKCYQINHQYSELGILRKKKTKNMILIIFNIIHIFNCWHLNIFL